MKTLTYEQFKDEYVRLFMRMMSYSPAQVGSGIYCEKMADLVDAHPGFEGRMEDELEQTRKKSVAA